MSNIDRLLQQQQGLESFRNASRTAFNGYDLQKEIYDSKKSALASAKGLAGQMVGQERLEAAIAAPGIAKSAIGLAKTGIRAAANPQEFAQAAKTAGYNTLKSQYKSMTGRDLPGSLEEAKAGVEGEARGAVEGATARATRTAQGAAQRFRQTVDDKTPEIENEARQGGRPAFEAPPARVPEPGDVDYAASQARMRDLSNPVDYGREVENVGGFPRGGLPAPRGSIGDPLPVTESENRANILRQSQRPEATAPAERPSASAQAQAEQSPELPELEGLKNQEQRIQEARQGLRPTETRTAEPDLAEAQRLGARPIARSVAREPLTAEEAQRAGYRPPTTPRPERPGRIAEEPGPTEGPGGYTRPGTDLRIPATREQVPQFRGEAPSAVAEREGGQTQSFLGDIERGGARVARGVRETATDDVLRTQEARASASRYGGQGIRAAGRPAEGYESMYPSLKGAESSSLDEDLDAAARRTTDPAMDAAIERGGERTLAQATTRGDYGLPNLPASDAPPSFPNPPSTSRGEESFEPGERADLQGRLDNLRGGRQLGPEPEGRPELQPEAAEAETRTYANPALNERFGGSAPTRPDLPDPGEPKVATRTKPTEDADTEPTEASSEVADKEVTSNIEKDALEKTGEEVAAEGPLDAIPGLGEVVMGATILGSLFHAHHEEKEAERQTAGPAPKAPTNSAPYMAFDAAPTLDTSSYHQA